MLEKGNKQLNKWDSATLKKGSMVVMEFLPNLKLWQKFFENAVGYKSVSQECPEPVKSLNK